MSYAMTAPARKHDLSPQVRMTLAAAGTALLMLSAFAVLRAAMGLAPATPWVRDFALLLHLATVIPALPLGMFIFLTRKGGPRHKLLGKIWLALMGVTAISTLFIRNIEDGGFSFIHIFSVMTLFAIPKAILTARRGQIDQHKAHLLGLFVGALLIAGGFSFLPGRTMWLWAFG